MDPYFSQDKNANNINRSNDFEIFNINKQSTLPPEPQIGNVEYKLKIVNPTKKRFEHLVTQLNWRLREGNGEAIYEIGVKDNGMFTGLTENEMKSSLQTLHQMAYKLGATITILGERTLDNGRKIAEVLVRKSPDEQNKMEVRLAVVGNTDAGKSTLLGVLTEGKLDNGKGRARLNMFRHLHEIQSGRTSSISHAILGFNSQGQPINCSFKELMTTEEVCEASTKLVNFLDLPGHKKYIRTTVQGLTGYLPHYAMLVISSPAGAVGITLEHLAILFALNVPFFIVITKTDLVTSTNTLQNLEYILKQSRREPIAVKDDDDITSEFTTNTVPIFCVSSVTGEGLDLLLKFLHVLSPNIGITEKEILEQESPEFHINENFRVDDVQILGGLLTKGLITEGDTLKIGPLKDGSFQDATVKSIYRNRVPCRIARAGQSASLCLDTIDVPNLRNGMVLVSGNRNPVGCFFFQATVSMLRHASPIYPGFQATVYIENIRQTAALVGIFASNCLQTNERASVLFKFKEHPEYVTVGQRLLFREGGAKGIGKITQVFPVSDEINYLI